MAGICQVELDLFPRTTESFCVFHHCQLVDDLTHQFKTSRGIDKLPEVNLESLHRLHLVEAFLSGCHFQLEQIRYIEHQVLENTVRVQSNEYTSNNTRIFADSLSHEDSLLLCQVKILFGLDENSHKEKEDWRKLVCDFCEQFDFALHYRQDLVTGIFFDRIVEESEGWRFFAKRKGW